MGNTNLNNTKKETGQKKTERPSAPLKRKLYGKKEKK